MAGEAGEVTRWEYETCQEHELDDYGSDGWEAYAIQPWSTKDRDGDEIDSGTTFYLKRRK